MPTTQATTTTTAMATTTASVEVPPASTTSKRLSVSNVLYTATTAQPVDAAAQAEKNP
jgi:hypothetical protein